MAKFVHYKQLDAMDCGATCLRMIAKYYGRSYSAQTLRQRSYITREGVSLLGISDAAESIGMHTMGVKTSIEKLIEENVTPFIAHWRQEHFVVVYGFKKASLRGSMTKQSAKDKEITSSQAPRNDVKVLVADPAEGLITYTKQEFLKYWASSEKNGEKQGIALLLEPTPNFYEQKGEKIDKTKFSFLFKTRDRI